MLKLLIVVTVVCSGCIASHSQQTALPQYRIGVELFSGTKVSCPIFVGRVYKDSPAAKGGIRPGDQLLAVDGGGHHGWPTRFQGTQASNFDVAQRWRTVHGFQPSFRNSVVLSSHWTTTCFER